MLFVRIALSSNEGSGESAQLRRLTRAFAARIHKVCRDVDKDSGQILYMWPRWKSQQERSKEAIVHA